MSVVYHRIAPIAEIDAVVASGEVWGKAPRQVMGNGDASVKAYIGPLPTGQQGYEFETNVPPSRSDRFLFGRAMAEWTDGDPGVCLVPGHADYVKIAVRVTAVQR